MKFKWIKVLQYTVGKPVDLGDHVPKSLPSTRYATSDLWGSSDIVVAKEFWDRFTSTKIDQ